jgi:hypothetical protein
VDRWCAAKRVARGATMTLAQAWALSQRWYGDRLAPDFRRPTIDEAHAIFASVGLTGSFWDLNRP